MTAAAASAGPYQGAPHFGTVGYVAVSADEVAIIRGKMGLLRPKVGSEVAGRILRREVSSAELTPGNLKSSLRIAFANGGSWEFEIPRIYRKTAEQVIRVLSRRPVA
jgi:hypothetical protein